MANQSRQLWHEYNSAAHGCYADRREIAWKHFVIGTANDEVVQTAHRKTGRPADQDMSSFVWHRSRGIRE